MGVRESRGRRMARQLARRVAHGLAKAAITPWMAAASHGVARPGGVSTHDQRVLAGAYNGFGLDLLRELARTNESGNLLISPLGLAIALTLTANGARAETREAVAHALRLEGMRPEAVNERAAALKRALLGSRPAGEGAGALRVAIANALWARQGLRFRQRFVRDSRAYFEARVEALDFSRPDAPEIINGWVRDSTEGGIDELVSEIDPLVALFVTDAVYFKGNWATPFDPEHTRPQTFHQADGDEPEVPMMVRHGEFGYWAEPGLQAVSLPYSGDRLVFDVLLPDRVDGLLPLIEALDAGTLHERLGDFTPQRGTVMLPRVTLSYGAEIREALAALGMGVAFDSGRADLSGMVVGGGPGDLYISRVQHGTTLELSEEGTVAAAATVAEVRVRSIAPPGFELLADHPFMLAVRDRLTDAVLFAGLYRGPTA